jgi:hypothetical protein
LVFQAAVAAAFSGADDVKLTKKVVFQLVSCAYDVRSRIVHGSELRARDVRFESAPDGYPETIEDRLKADASRTPGSWTVTPFAATAASFPLFRR